MINVSCLLLPPPVEIMRLALIKICHGGESTLQISCLNLRLEILQNVDLEDVHLAMETDNLQCTL